MRLDLEEDDITVNDESSDELENDFDNNEPVTGNLLPSQKTTWREIEKKRELIALSRMIGENIDDKIFN